MSLLGRVATLAIRWMRGKRDLRDKAALDAAIARRRPIDRHAPSKKFRTRYSMRIDDEGGHPCYRLGSRDTSTIELRLLYLHGGCYTYEITPYHWDFLGRLVDRVPGLEITIPIYPLAPEVDHRATFAMIEPLCERLAAAGPYAIAGDSAGGGIALALAQRRQQEGRSKPRAIVLLSPWLDIALRDPSIAELEAIDPMLGKRGLIAAGSYWAGPVGPDDPLVSPLFGKLDDLAPIAILVGGHEIFLPDARRLRDRLHAEARPITYLEEPRMFHVWPLVTLLPEAKRALAFVANTLVSR